MSYLKSITTFSLDTKLKERFYSKVQSNNRTKTIEILLDDYLTHLEKKNASSSTGKTHHATNKERLH